MTFPVVAAHVLALGVEPRDALRGQRVAHPVRIDLERPFGPARKIIDRRPLVVGFGEIRRMLDDSVQYVERPVILTGIHAPRRLLQQEIVGRAARVHPQAPDRLLDDLRLPFALGRFKSPEQTVEQFLALFFLAEILRHWLKRLIDALFRSLPEGKLRSPQQSDKREAEKNDPSHPLSLHTQAQL